MSKFRCVLVVGAFFLFGACGDVHDPEDLVDPGAVVENQSLFTTGAQCARARNCAPLAHAAASCRNNRCNYSCLTGFKACGGRCIPNASCCTSADCAGAGTVCGGTCGSNGVCSYPTGTCGSPTCSSTTTRVGAGTCSAGRCVLPAAVSCPVNTVCTGAGLCGCAPGAVRCSSSQACVVPGANFCDNGPTGNTGAYGGCNPDCTLGPRCGDGIVNGPEACDSPAGNGLAPGQCNPACSGTVLTRHIRQTTGTFAGTFAAAGGVAGADAVCTGEFGANYRAFIAGPGRTASRTPFVGDGANWVLSPYRQYLNAAEAQIWTTDATPLLGVRNGVVMNILNPISVIVPDDGQFGTWTGMNPDYTTTIFANGLASCNGWVTNSSLFQGTPCNASELRVGLAFPNNNGISNCDFARHVLCVEQ